MSRTIRALLTAGAAVAVLAGTATVVQADEDPTRTTASDAAEAARQAAAAAAAARAEAIARAQVPQQAVTFTAAHSGKCLEVEGGKTTDGINVQQYDCNGTDSQKWNAIATRGGTFELRNAKTGKCLEIQGKSVKTGAAVQQFACGQGDHQRWRMILVDPVRTMYELQPAHAEGMCVDVPGQKQDNGIDAQLYSCNRTVAQLWQVRPVA
ncbi:MULTISPECIES: RICIN domain-containing protein [unclassified Streptomyces]|uniref:RICIN domain-containing protein n=1 Tax=unclassified Streptomyces TaxID=2593676 RepID=UPI003667483D